MTRDNLGRGACVGAIQDAEEYELVRNRQF
jgi:hypothetical protein